MYYIGIDMSVASPGLVIYNEIHNKYFFYFYAIRKKEMDFYEDTKKYCIKSFEYPEWNTREERFEKICDHILKRIQFCIGPQEKHKIGIEGYSFGSQSQSMSRLYEIGGVIRNKLYNEKYNFIELSPTKIKKNFTGKGNVNKVFMYEQFKEERLVDFFDILSIKESKVGNIPSPISDFVDAYAIIQCLRNISHKPINIVNNILNKI